MSGKKAKLVTVFIITSGEYSDYGVRGVSLTRQNAQKAIDKARAAEEYWANDASIEEWPADQILGFRKFKTWGCGLLLDDGSIVEPRNGGSSEREQFSNYFRGCTSQYDVKVPAYNNRAIVRTVSSVSQEHANKLAVEARQKWLREKANA